jgi:hypothetical protein
VLNAVVADV